MNALSQFLTVTSGGILGILIASLFVKRGRPQYLWALGMAVGMGLTFPIYNAISDKWQYGSWLLPVLGGILGAAGGLVGQLVAKAWAKRAGPKS
jgi:hypothetical protein